MDIEAIYENIKKKNKNTVGPQTQSQNRTKSQDKNRWFVVVTVCLGLFCVLLVIALILLYIYLTAERDQMKMRNMNITEEFNETLNSLMVNYNLTNEKNQLQKNLNSVMQKKVELETRVKNLTDALKKSTAPGSVWYFISTEKKSWSESRQYCRDRGGDLIIINTEQEQQYISSLVKDDLWIGLSDIQNEGNMKWVDNTPLTKGFWFHSQPNDANGNEDCVEISSASKPPLSNWNDFPCSEKRKWICEN